MSNDSLMADVAGAGTAAEPVVVDITNQPIDIDVLTLPEPVATEPFLQTTPQLTSAVVNGALLGDNVLVAAVAGQVIRVYRLILVFAGACTVTIYNGAAGAALTGAMSMSQYGSIVLDFDGEPWFTTTAGLAFVANLSAGVQMSGCVYYTQG